jgi:hypothetical protein
MDQINVPPQVEDGIRASLKGTQETARLRLTADAVQTDTADHFELALAPVQRVDTVNRVSALTRCLASA